MQIFSCFRGFNFVIAKFDWECVNSGTDYWNGGMEIFESSFSKIGHKFLKSQHIYFTLFLWLIYTKLDHCNILDDVSINTVAVHL